MALALAQRSSQLAAWAQANRRFVRTSSGPDAREDSGLQRLGLVTSNAGQTYTLYYDPSSDTIVYDTGNVIMNVQ